MSDSPVDPDALIELVDEDFELLEALVDTFLEECPEYLDAIRAAVTERDAEALQSEAHRLKGAVGNLRAKPASEAVQRLEQVGESGDFEEAQEALDDLEREIERLQTALTDLKQEYQRHDALNGSA